MAASQLTVDRLAGLHAMLLEQRAFRREQLVQLHVPGTHGPLSSEIPEIFAELATGARAALRDVEAALRRMDEGSYGVCVDCGHRLDAARLEILPQVARCLPCQPPAS